MGQFLRKNKEKNKFIIKIILTVIMAAGALLFITPLLWMVSASLKKAGEVFAYPIKWIPDEFMFSNYKFVWMNKYYPFYIAYYNSIKVTFLTIIGALFICTTAAYAFTMIEFKGRNAIFMMFLATIMIPPQVTLIPRYALFYKFNLYNNHLALILPGSFFVLGIFLLRQFYLSIPMELPESAKIDGASHFVILTRIILPVTKPAMVSIIILVFITMWNEYLNPLIFITKKQLYTIPLGLQALLDDEMRNYNYIMAAASSAIVTVIVVFLSMQKYFIQGITRTGIKG
ncbi:MAG: carbohydrate ABC transporter permease [Clostridiaceae bacterium]|jgi:multiple sugar transport system permease protein|nr:carbohydrate ABC transporter permease [Clostridiaceae bacterium]